MVNRIIRHITYVCGVEIVPPLNVEKHTDMIKTSTNASSNPAWEHSYFGMPRHPGGCGLSQ